MLISAKSDKIEAIRPGDKLWNLTDGLMVSSRAAIEISLDCPTKYQDVINFCIQNGYLKPVAYMKSSEKTMEYLKC